MGPSHARVQEESLSHMRTMKQVHRKSLLLSLTPFLQRKNTRGMVSPRGAVKRRLDVTAVLRLVPRLPRYLPSARHY